LPACFWRLTRWLRNCLSPGRLLRRCREVTTTTI